MLINSAQLSALYSHPWPLLMNIDSDLSGPKSQKRRAMVSRAGKQNSQRINMAGRGRVRAFICLTAACSIIRRIKGKQTAAGTGSRQLSRPRQTYKRSGWLCLVVFFINSVYLLPYLSKMDTNEVTNGARERQNQMSDTQWEWSNTASEAYHACRLTTVSHAVSRSRGPSMCRWSHLQWGPHSWRGRIISNNLLHLNHMESDIVWYLAMHYFIFLSPP